MSLLVAVFFVTFACANAQESTVVRVSDLNQLPEANGDTDFNYFTEKAAAAAAVFTSYPNKYDCAVAEYVTELLNQYTNHGAIVDECVSGLDYPDALNKAVTEALVRVQTLDNDLRSNAAVCTSLRVPESDGCEQERQRAQEALAGVASEQEYERIHVLMKESVASTKSFLNSCINANVNQ